MASMYEKIDSLILSSIAAGRGTFGKLLEGELAVECKRIAEAQGPDQFDRVLDRRLQALRKAKRILHQDGRWSVIDSLHRVGPEEEARMRAYQKRAKGVAG